MLNVIKWITFIVVVFGSLVGCGIFSNDKPAAIAILLIGICTSLHAFLFIPYGNKFYLYELIIIIFTWAAESTVIFNLTRTQPAQEWMWAPVVLLIAFTTLVVPFIVFAYIEKRRPKNERLMEKARVESGRPALAQTRASSVFLMITNIIFMLLTLAVIAENARPERTIFQPFPVLILMGQGVFLFGNWRTYRRLSNSADEAKKMED